MYIDHKKAKTNPDYITQHKICAKYKVGIKSQVPEAAQPAECHYYTIFYPCIVPL